MTDLICLEFKALGKYHMSHGFSPKTTPADFASDLRDSLLAEVRRFGGRVDAPRFGSSVFVYVPSIILTDMEERIASVHRLIQEHLDKGGDPGEDWINTCLAKVDFDLLKYDQKSIVTEAEITAEKANPMHLKGRELESLLERTEMQARARFIEFEKVLASKLQGVFPPDKNWLTPDKKGP